MSWFFSASDDDEDDNLLFSPALMARRASESWIDTLPMEVQYKIINSNSNKTLCFVQNQK